MILGYKTHWPDGRPTYFQQKILTGLDPMATFQQFPKIHTFRKGNRWKEGMTIQHATGVRTKNYNQFFHGRCKGVQCATIGIEAINGLYIVIHYDAKFPSQFRFLTPEELLLFAANDGFDSIDDLQKWFFPTAIPYQDYCIEGQIIHFTDFKY
jgi:hypothetical protein